MTWRLLSLATLVLAFVMPICLASRTFGQECPQANATGPNIASQVETLKGRLIYHDGIRQWFELKLDKPQCGESSIQLVSAKENHTPLETFRGCHIKSKGKIDFSPTGYYSLELVQNVDQVTPVIACRRQALLPDVLKPKPDPTISAYRVDMHVIYPSEDHPITFRVSSGGRTLRPWQAYASYMLTGGFVLYGQCGEGFAVEKVLGTPEAHPGHFDDDMASFDPESAAASGQHDLHLGYTCIRAPG